VTERYARLYHRFAREFPAVYRDDHLLAWWTRLLIVADASWPMRQPIPRAVPGRVLTRLVDEGLVIPDGDAYTVRGLDAERGRRAEAGRAGAAMRWQSDGNANASADAMPNRAEQSRTEQSTPRDGLPNLTPEAIRLLESKTGYLASQAGDRQLTEYDRLVGAHPLPDIHAAFTKLNPTGKAMTARQLVWSAVKVLEPFPDTKQLASAEREQENEAAGQRHRVSSMRQIHGYGGHEAEPRDGCPLCQEVTA
jgi:hypothetical protein